MKKKLLAILLTIAVVACFALVLTACKVNDPQPTPSQPTQLAAPQISLNGNVVSWSAVANADSYDVKVGSDAAVNVTATSYTIGEKPAGSYNVTVVAKSSSDNYTDSPASNIVTYTVEAAPTLKELRVTGNYKTVYYLDENATALDLTGARFAAIYTSGSPVELQLSDISFTQPQMTEGDHPVVFTYTGGGTPATATVTFTVRERTKADIETYKTVLAEYDKTTGATYDVGNYAAAYDMRGNSVLDAATGKATLPNGETLLRAEKSDGTAEYVLATVAYFIDSASDFAAIAEDMAGYYVLTKNIDFENAWQNMIGKVPLDTDNKLDIAGNGSVSAADRSGQIGEAFTGTLDGQGYALMNYRMAVDESVTPYWSGAAYGMGIFGYVGEGGVLRNVTLRNVYVGGGQNAALLAGCNLGRIENVCIESTCVLYSHFGRGAAVSFYNEGTIENVVCEVTELNNRNNTPKALILAARGTETDAAGEQQTVACEVTNGFTDKADHTAILGAYSADVAVGWKYFEGFGTVLVNADYVRITATETEISLGGTLALRDLFADGDAVNAAFYAVDSDNADKTAQLELRWNAETKTHDVAFVFDEEHPLTIAVGEQYTIALYATGWKGFDNRVLTVTAPYVLSVQSVRTENVTVTEGNDLDLTAIELNVTWSSGDKTATVHPTSVTGFDKDTLGQQNVTFFYNEMSVQGTVTVQQALGTLSAALKTGVSEIILATTEEEGQRVWSLSSVADWSQYLTVTDGDGETVANYTVAYAASSAASGNSVSLIVSATGYAPATVDGVALYFGVATAEDWNLINDNLDGNFVLTQDVAFTKNTSTMIGRAATTTADNGSQEAIAFTGTLDGRNHTVSGIDLKYTRSYGKDGSIHQATETAWQPSCYGFGVFGYVGANASVRNLVLSNVTVYGGQDTALLAGANDGTIENVTISSNCTLISYYGRAAAIAYYNNGEIKNAVSYMTTSTQGNNNAVSATTLVGAGSTGTVTDSYIGAPYVTEITSVEPITVPQNGTIELDNVTLNVLLSTGATSTAHPTSIDGEYSTATAGTITVTLVWTDGTHTVTKGNVTVTVYEVSRTLNVEAKAGVTEVIVPYGAEGWKIEYVDWTQYVTATVDDGSGSPTATTDYTVTSADLSGEGVTFTFKATDCEDKTITLNAYLEIKDAASFLAVNDNLKGWYKMTADVELSNSYSQSIIGSASAAFTGVLDGTMKTVSGISVTSGSNAGIFYGTSSVKLTGTIKNIVFVGTINTSGQYVGTLAQEFYGTAENVFSAVNITAANRIGGIADNIYGTVTGCVYVGNISGTNAGGIVRKTQSGGNVTNCLYLVPDGATVTAYFASSKDAKGTETNCFAHSASDVTTNGQSYYGLSNEMWKLVQKYVANGSVTDAAMNVALASGASDVVIPYSDGWKLGNVSDWSAYLAVTDGDDAALSGYTVSLASGSALSGDDVQLVVSKDGYLSANITVTAYLGVADYTQFAAINDNLSGWYKLTGNVDFKDSEDVNHSVQIGELPMNGEGGDDGYSICGEGSGATIAGKAFTGRFDGNGYTISNYKFYNESSAKEAYGGALFAFIGENAFVGNFTMKNGYVMGWVDLALVGGRVDGTIKNVVIESDCKVISIWGNASSPISSVAAYLNGTIENALAYVSVGYYGYTTEKDLPIVNTVHGGTTTNCYVNGVTEYNGSAVDLTTTDLTSVLGDGWSFVSGSGNVYGTKEGL